MQKRSIILLVENERKLAVAVEKSRSFQKEKKESSS